MPGQTAVFTIVAKNYLASARVLMHSVARHHPDWRRYVVLCDHVDGYFDPRGEDFELILSQDLPIAQSAWFHFKYSVLELCTAVKPYAFEHLFGAESFERIVYLDPDIRLYSPLHEVTKALEEASIALTPHLAGPFEEGATGATEILKCGTYNLGFIGLARSPETTEFLAWWRSKLFNECIIDFERGLFLDQKWMDLAPGMFQSVAIIRHPAYNVAYWNLSQRDISNTPPAFFHFSGYDPARPERLSRHRSWPKVASLPAPVRQMLNDYRAELLAAGHRTCRKWPYAFGAFHNGVRVPDLARPVHREAPALPGELADPFSDGGFQAIRDVWNSPAPNLNPACPGISRLAYRIYRAAALPTGIPEAFGPHYDRFLHWILASGKADHGVDEALLTAVTDAIREREESDDENLVSAAAVGQAPGLRFTQFLAAIYRSRPDLRSAFPDPCGRDGPGFLVWLLTYGKKEYRLTPRQLAPMKKQWSSVAGAILPGVPARWRLELTLRAMTASTGIRRGWESVRRLSGKFKASRKPAPDWPEVSPPEPV